MLVNVKSQLNDQRIQELIASSVFPDPDQISNVIINYRENEHLKLMGFETEGEIIGIIGYQVNEEKTLEINHLAVLPEVRGKGYGRGIILETLELEKPQAIVAVTDEDAAEFYRNIGFSVESLGEKYPGVETFRSTYITELD